MNEIKHRPAPQVGMVMLHGMGLAFKDDIHICVMLIAITHQVYQIVNQIDDKEWQEQQLDLLHMMDAFMVDEDSIFFIFPFFKKYKGEHS
jgi:hypothetical protein